MSIYKAIGHMRKLEKLNEQWERQGLTEHQRKVRINAYLDETKRKHLKEDTY